MKKHLIALGVAALAVGALPVIAAAHNAVPGVDCKNGTVTITVSGWAGEVRITEAKSGTEKGEWLPPSADSSVTVKSADIGGDGSYQITRENPGSESLAGDGKASFTVSCTTPSPTPTPSLTPTPGATPTPSPSASPTGGTSPATTNPTPSPGGGLGQGVLAANTTAPGLPAAGAGPGDLSGGLIVALAVALVSVLAVTRLVKARR